MTDRVYYVEPGFIDPDTGSKVSLLVNENQGVNDTVEINWPTTTGTIAVTSQTDAVPELVATGSASFTGADSVSITYHLYSFGVIRYFFLEPASFTASGAAVLTCPTLIPAAHRPSADHSTYNMIINEEKHSVKIKTTGDVVIALGLSTNLTAGASTSYGFFCEYCVF